MSQCPHGDHKLQLPVNSEMNLDFYGGQVLSVTLCCGKGVHARRVSGYHATADKSGATEDDWGRMIKK